MSTEITDVAYWRCGDSVRFDVFTESDRDEHRVDEVAWCPRHGWTTVISKAEWLEAHPVPR